MKNKTFNVVVTGVGGQGIITLTRIIAQAAYIEGLEAKITEVHGLAQRGGYVWCHVRFGKKVHSPLIKQADADLVISFEPLEALRIVNLVSAKTKLIINSDKVIPLSVSTDKKPYPTINKIKAELNKLTKHVDFFPATTYIKKQVGSTVPLNIYMLGLASAKNIIPLSESSLIESIRKTVKPKFFNLNKKVFQLAK